MRDRVIWIVPVSGLSNLLLIRRARVAKTTMELHYKATVDNKEWEVSSIEVEEQWKLKDLRTSLLSENLWDETSAVSFFRDFHPATKQLAFTTKVHQLLADNSEDNPLVVIVVLPPKDQPSNRFAKRPKTIPLVDPNLFYSPSETPIPVPHEENEMEPFVAPANWLSETCSAILTQANLQESDNPRVSPIAFVRCSRGGKTRAMMEIMAQIRRQDPSYSILFVTLNTATPLPKIHSLQKYDPVAELCVRIAFGALKSRQPYNREEFEEFSKHHSVDEVWVKDWLQDEKCILFIDELNLLQGSMDENMAEFLKNIFLLDKGRGLVFSSHVASISRKLATFMSSPGNREVITRPLPFIPSLQIAREKLKWQNLSAREALYLGLIPGLLVEKKNNRPTTTRRAEAVQEYIQSVGSDGCTGASVALLLSTLLTGNVESVDEHLQELMTADIAQDGETTILRWIPFHMSFVLQQVSQQCLVVPLRTRHCYSAIAELLVQFGYGKWESGDAWEALFLVVLIVRCLSTKFDDHVVPLAHCPFSEEGCVGYNYPYGGSDFFTKDPAAFIGGIPISSWGQGGQSAISIYYPGHARFEAYDIILAAWDRTYGTRTLYGYQLKDGSATPKPHAFDNIFEKSFLIRGAAKLKTTSVKRWNAVSDSDLDAFFGESALQWSAKAWKKLESAN